MNSSISILLAFSAFLVESYSLPSLEEVEPENAGMVASCDEGWTYYVSTNECYKWFATGNLITWSEAQSNCSSLLVQKFYINKSPS